MKYPKRTAENILPLSKSKDLPEALSEWYFTEKVADHGAPTENCGLCSHEKLRYHFQIKNRNTDAKLWVGSSCIIKFQVQVFDKGALLDSNKAKVKLNDLAKAMRLDSCVKSLQTLAASEKNKILVSALEFYQKNNYLTPKFAFVVFWRLNHHKIDHSASFFKVILNKDRYKSDLKNMPLDRVHVIWPALTSAQRKLAISMGHSAPE